MIVRFNPIRSELVYIFDLIRSESSHNSAQFDLSRVKFKHNGMDQKDIHSKSRFVSMVSRSASLGRLTSCVVTNL